MHRSFNKIAHSRDNFNSHNNVEGRKWKNEYKNIVITKKYINVQSLSALYYVACISSLMLSACLFFSIYNFPVYGSLKLEALISVDENCGHESGGKLMEE